MEKSISMFAQEIKPTSTVEDYLQYIHRMEKDGKKVIAARLAELLNHSMPTVTLTLKRMVRDNWIIIDDRKEIHMTISGKQAAESIIRKHMLTEWMLMRMLNIPWSDVHHEADEIEHTISNRVEFQLDSNLDFPSTCPHGNPLPGHEKMTSSWIPLTEVEIGSQAIVRRVHEIAEDSQETLRFLEANNIIPGTVVQINEVLPFNQTITLQIDKQLLSLGWSIAKLISVEKQL